MRFILVLCICTLLLQHVVAQADGFWWQQEQSPVGQTKGEGRYGQDEDVDVDDGDDGGQRTAQNDVCPRGYSCVDWFLCDNGTIVDDGAGLLDKRIKPTTQQLEDEGIPCGEISICCREPTTDYTNQPTSQQCRYDEDCVALEQCDNGHINTDGFGLIDERIKPKKCNLSPGVDAVCCKLPADLLPEPTDQCAYGLTCSRENCRRKLPNWYTGPSNAKLELQRPCKNRAYTELGYCCPHQPLTDCGVDYKCQTAQCEEEDVVGHRIVNRPVHGEQCFLDGTGQRNAVGQCCPDTSPLQICPGSLICQTTRCHDNTDVPGEDGRYVGRACLIQDILGFCCSPLRSCGPDYRCDVGECIEPHVTFTKNPIVHEQLCFLPPGYNSGGNSVGLCCADPPILDSCPDNLACLDLRCGDSNLSGYGPLSPFIGRECFSSLDTVGTCCPILDDCGPDYSCTSSCHESSIAPYAQINQQIHLKRCNLPEYSYGVCCPDPPALTECPGNLACVPDVCTADRSQYTDIDERFYSGECVLSTGGFGFCCPALRSCGTDYQCDLAPCQSHHPSFTIRAEVHEKQCLLPSSYNSDRDVGVCCADPPILQTCPDNLQCLDLGCRDSQENAGYGPLSPYLGRECFSSYDTVGFCCPVLDDCGPEYSCSASCTDDQIQPYANINQLVHKKRCNLQGYTYGVCCPSPAAVQTCPDNLNCLDLPCNDNTGYGQLSTSVGRTCYSSFDTVGFCCPVLDDCGSEYKCLSECGNIDQYTSINEAVHEKRCNLEGYSHGVCCPDPILRTCPGSLECQPSICNINDGAGLIDERLLSRPCYLPPGGYGGQELGFCCPKILEDCGDGFRCRVSCTEEPKNYQPGDTSVYLQKCRAYNNEVHVCCPHFTPKIPQHCGVRNENLDLRLRPSQKLEKNEAEFAEFPWQAIIFFSNNTFRCGASIVSDQFVITGAHCVNGHAPSNLRVRVGEWQINTPDPEPYEDVVVSHVVIHPQFNSRNLRNNVALLRLSTPLKFNYHINTICLPQYGELEEFVNAGARCIATGWGKDAFTGQYQHIMKRVEIPLVDNPTCQLLLRETRLGQYFRLHRSFMCAGGEENKDACKGDGGGPLVCRRHDGYYTLVGITSWGIGCGEKDIPGVYADVGYFSDWINDNMDGSRSSNTGGVKTG